MTFIIVALFVMGVKVVINGVADHWRVDLDWLYDFAWKSYGAEAPMWWKTISKPLYYCNVCMSSVWGTVGYLLTGWHSWQHWILHIVICAAIVSAVNWIESKI